MNTFAGFFSSSIGRKLLMGLTGLFLCSFLVVHFTGNLLLFKSDGGAAFDAYSGFMATNFVIRTIEIGLFAGFLLHIGLGIHLWMTNRKVRSEDYAVKPGSATSPLASRTAFVTGSIVFIFLVIHLRTFFFPGRFGTGEVSMYGLVREAFTSPVYSGFYVVALVLLGYHLRHGFQ